MALLDHVICDFFRQCDRDEVIIDHMIGMTLKYLLHPTTKWTNALLEFQRSPFPPTHKHNHSQLLAWNVMIKDHGFSLSAIKLLDIALYLFFFNWLTFVHIFSWILHCFNVWFIVLNNNIHIVSMTKWCQMWDLLIVINRNKVLQLYILINLNCLAVHYSY